MWLTVWTCRGIVESATSSHCSRNILARLLHRAVSGLVQLPWQYSERVCQAIAIVENKSFLVSISPIAVPNISRRMCFPLPTTRSSSHISQRQHKCFSQHLATSRIHVVSFWCIPSSVPGLGQKMMQRKRLRVLDAVAVRKTLHCAIAPSHQDEYKLRSKSVSSPGSSAETHHA